MYTSIRLRTDGGSPYNVTMDVRRVEIQTMSDQLPRSIPGGTTFTVEVLTFHDLARIIAVLTPGAVATLREALMADSEAIRAALV